MIRIRTVQSKDVKTLPSQTKAEIAGKSNHVFFLYLLIYIIFSHHTLDIPNKEISLKLNIYS